MEAWFWTASHPALRGRDFSQRRFGASLFLPSIFAFGKCCRHEQFPTHMKKRVEQMRVVHMDALGTEKRAADAWRLHRPGAIEEVILEDNRTRLFRTSSRVALRIRLWSAEIVQFSWHVWRVATEEFSYAIDPGHPFGESPPHDWAQTGEAWVLRTPALTLSLRKKDAHLRIEDVHGQLLYEDAEGFACRETIMTGLAEWRLRAKAPKNAWYHGLGDKACRLNLRGRRFTNWNTDTFMYGADTDPMYKTIPFFIQTTGKTASGFFLDNTYRSRFDFDSRRKGVLEVQAAGGPFSWFFIAGPAYLDVCRRYALLTGKAPLPPLWALGFHQCRWSYFPESRVKEVAATFRKLDIPCDALWLDIDYMDGYRCFTWNLDYFPDPKGMIQWLRDKGFRTVVMIDPGIRIDEAYFAFQHGTDHDVWCKRSNGEWMIGPVWPPDCVFPDFTHPKVRAWWGALYRELYVHQEVDGFWNDMNEPAVFKVQAKTFPDTVVHHYDGHPTDHRQAHNVYGQQMSRATFEGLRKLKPHQRPFVLTRATYAGGQRYAAVWTGDNVATWEHLAIALRQVLRLSVSGFSFAGSDIGGFVGRPDGQLLVRWLQLGAFHPLFRIHSIGDNEDGDAAQENATRTSPARPRMDQEPWSFGEPWTTYAREAIALRYRLLPYFYTLCYQHQQDGTPLLWPLGAGWPDDPWAVRCEEAFMLGPALLVWPILKPDLRTKTIYLPKGEWFHLLTGKRYGQGKHRLRVRHDSILAFAKAGTVVPMHPVRAASSMPLPDAPSLRIFAGNSEAPSHWYEDAGDGYAYLEGHYRLAEYELSATGHSLTLSQNLDGSYALPHSEVKLEWVLPAGIRPTLRVDRQDVPMQRHSSQGCWLAKVPADFRQAVCTFASETG